MHGKAVNSQQELGGWLMSQALSYRSGAIVLFPDRESNLQSRQKRIGAVVVGTASGVFQNTVGN